MAMSIKDFLKQVCPNVQAHKAERGSQGSPGVPRAPRVQTTTINLQDGTCRLSRLKPKSDRSQSECELIVSLVDQANKASQLHRAALTELAKLGPFSKDELAALHWNHHRGLPFSIMGLIVGDQP